MDYLRAYAEAMGAGKLPGKGVMETVAENDEDDEDDEVPDLVENFEEAAAK